MIKLPKAYGGKAQGYLNSSVGGDDAPTPTFNIPRKSNQQAFGLNLLSPVGLCFEGLLPVGNLGHPSLDNSNTSKETFSFAYWDIKIEVNYAN